jgi:murein DD-endopeptidase MepM/ murein hydrolase activator NlpD
VGARAATISAAGLAIVLGLLCLPILVTTSVNAGGACATEGTTGPVAAGSMAAIEATIRQVESGDNYTARAAGSSASGAYQFLDTSWASYGGYTRAYLAPPAIQDAKAAAVITAVLAANHDDVTAVPVAWYLGHVPPPGSPEWDAVPAPGAGNRLMPRQYQERWMAIYQTELADPAAGGTAGTAVICSSQGSTSTLPGGWALPGPRALLDRTAEEINAPHHDYPAWDWLIPAGTPIFAIRGGLVTAVSTYSGNCAGEPTCQPCGLGVTITDAQGVQWTYCHGSILSVTQGEAVGASQQILTSGDSGDATGPHVHIQIRDAGILRCPQPLIASLYHDGVGLDPASLPTSGCIY